MKNRFYMFLLLILCSPIAHAAESNTFKLQTLLGEFEAEAILHGNTKIEAWKTLRVQFMDLIANQNNPADPNVSSLKSGTTVLQLAALMGDIDFVQFLLRNGADINQSDYDQLTPLVLACGARHCGMVSFLMNSGANPNIESYTTGTALSYVASFGYTEMVYLLLRHGADPNHSEFGISPINLATSFGDVPSVVLLLAFGSQMPTDLASEEYSRQMRIFFLRLFQSEMELFDVLLEYATQSRNRQLRLHILEAQRCASSGGNVLHFAIVQRQEEGLLQYLELFQDSGILFKFINQENSLGETPLFLALMFRNEHAIQDLLDYGAIPNFGSLNFANNEFVSQGLRMGATMVSYNISPRLLRRIFQLHVIHDPEIVERFLLASQFNTPVLSQIVVFLISLSYAHIQIPFWPK